MRTVELSDETFDALQEIAEPLVDTTDSVVQKLIRLYRQQNGRISVQTDGTSGRGGRARKGEKTPNQEFYEPIIEVLHKAGGELEAGTAVDRVGELMKDRLNDVDRANLKSGEIRWRNTVRFARNDLVKQGRLDSEAPFGLWRIAPSAN